MRLDEPMLEHGVCRSHAWMSGKRQLLARGEDPQPVVGARLGWRQHEGGLGQVQPGGDRLHGGRAGVLDRGQGVADGAALPGLAGSPLDREGRRRDVDVGWQEPDAESCQFLAEAVQLVGVADVERHRRRHEFQRVVGLEKGRLIGDQGIGGGVRLVEAVAGELGDQVEDIGGAILRHAARHAVIPLLAEEPVGIDRLQRLAIRFDGRIGSIDINPVLLTKTGCIGVDGLIVQSDKT